VNNSDGSKNSSKRLSISTSIRVSYNYLSDKNKVCGQYLSCFPASFTLDAAVAIVGSLTNQSKDSIKECLKTLQRLSLLQRSSDGEKMYDFHKLLKDFFNSELNSSEEELKFERTVQRLVHMIKPAYYHLELLHYNRSHYNVIVADLEGSRLSFPPLSNL